jgi:hypothetical protein
VIRQIEVERDSNGALGIGFSPFSMAGAAGLGSKDVAGGSRDLKASDLRHDCYVVCRLVQHAPALRCGKIQVGDLIWTIDDCQTRSLTIEQLTSKIKGQARSIAKLGISSKLGMSPSPGISSSPNGAWGNNAKGRGEDGLGGGEGKGNGGGINGGAHQSHERERESESERQRGGVGRGAVVAAGGVAPLRLGLSPVSPAQEPLLSPRGQRKTHRDTQRHRSADSEGASGRKATESDTKATDSRPGTDSTLGNGARGVGTHTLRSLSVNGAVPARLHALEPNSPQNSSALRTHSPSNSSSAVQGLTKDVVIERGVNGGLGVRFFRCVLSFSGVCCLGFKTVCLALS